jgi:hypothetical protein
MKINKEWHQANRMPPNPTIEERLAWHLEHAKNCSCRKMPANIAALLQKKTEIPFDSPRQKNGREQN